MQRTEFLKRLGIPGRKIVRDRIVAEWKLEGLRQVLRRELRVHSGQRVLARSLGISRAVIRKFLEMRSVPTPENMALLTNWAADRPEMDTPLGAVCLAVLSGELEPRMRYAGRRRVAEALAGLYAESASKIPAWLADELSGRGNA
jgi:hypothetical protein